MSRTRIVDCGVAGLLAFLLALVAPASTGATDLAEAAKQEKLRRAGKSSKTFTEDDLLRLHAEAPVRPVTVVATPAPKPASAPAWEADDDIEAVADAEDGDRLERAAAWRTTLREARDEASRLATDVDQARQGLSDVRGVLYGAGRASQADRLAKLTQQLANAQERVAVLEDGGRRRGYGE